MKKVCYLLLAVLMILPLLASCGGAEGTPVEVANVKIIIYKNAYTGATGETPTLDKSLGEVISSDPITATVEEGVALTVKHVVDAYANNIDGAAVYDADNNIYTKLAGLTAEDGFFWNYYVNGKEASLSTEIQATDTIEIVFEK